MKMLINFLYRQADAKEVLKLLPLLNLHPGGSVAEVGAGQGQAAEFLALAVGPAGKVVATDFEPDKIIQLQERMRLKNLNQVQIIQAGDITSNLPAGAFDAILMRKVYHHFTHPFEMNTSFYAALKPGGRLAVIDFPPKWFLSFSVPEGIPGNRGGHGIKKELVVEEVLQAGFIKIKVIEKWMPFGMYCAVFEKP